MTRRSFLLPDRTIISCRAYAARSAGGTSSKKVSSLSSTQICPKLEAFWFAAQFKWRLNSDAKRESSTFAKARATCVQNFVGYGSASFVRQTPLVCPINGTCGLPVKRHSPLFAPWQWKQLRWSSVICTPNSFVAFLHAVPNAQKVTSTWKQTAVSRVEGQKGTARVVI